MSTQVQPKAILFLVAGQPVYAEDLSPTAQGQLRQLALQEYERRKRTLERILEQHLLEAEARARAVSAETLLSQTVDKYIPDPTEPEVRAFYLGLKDRMNRPFEEARPDLVAMLKQARAQEAREAYLATLRERSKATIALRPPRVEVRADPDRLRGDPGARITIVEFSDFQCPFCKKSEPILKELLTKYGKEVNLSYRDFPLKELHPQAELAAEGALCAGEQSSYWEFHDMLFDDPSTLERANLLEKAARLKLDIGRFSACLDSGRYQSQIDQDVQDGIRAGVSATPAFFINGVFLGGLRPLAEFEAIIREELLSPHAEHRENSCADSP
jgi:protein-disulfide isomerase